MDQQTARLVRIATLLLAALQAAFVVYLTIRIAKIANPKGDGMEFMGVGAVVMLAFLPFTLPALLIGWRGQDTQLKIAAILAAIGAAVMAFIWFQLRKELNL